MCAWPFRFKEGCEEQLDELYERVVFLVRYMRGQTVRWAWNLDEDEARRYERAVGKWVKKETGVPEAAAAPLFPSPFGFGDYEGGG